MKLGWLSDIHLNFLDETRLRLFFRGLAGHDVDGWLVGGDIGEASSVAAYLHMFATELSCPTYFVLGNHDFYEGTLAGVRTWVAQTARESERLVWLTDAEAQLLTDDVAIVGDDGWADARCGRPYETPVQLNDFYLIEELAGLSRAALVAKLQTLGDEAARRLGPKLTAAAASRRQVVVLLHVPPYAESAWHEGKPSDPDWVPWFACRAVGEVITACATDNPRTRFLVLCGHTHGSGVHAPAPNVVVHTASAQYGAPVVQRVIEL